MTVHLFGLNINLASYSCTLREQIRSERKRQQTVLFFGDVATLGLLHARIARMTSVRTYVPDVKNGNFTML